MGFIPCWLQVFTTPFKPAAMVYKVSDGCRFIWFVLEAVMLGSISPFNFQTSPLSSYIGVTDPWRVSNNGFSILTDILDAEVVQASLEISITAGDNPQALILRATLDRVNEALLPGLGFDTPFSITELNNSPEAVAGQILAMTELLGAFVAQQSGLGTDLAAQEFIDEIRYGFDRGFNEARSILDGLGVFNGTVQNEAIRTYELVQIGLDSFLARNLTLLTDTLALA